MPTTSYSSFQLILTAGKTRCDMQGTVTGFQCVSYLAHSCVRIRSLGDLYLPAPIQFST